MIIKVILIIFLILLLKIFIVKFDYYDYFNIMMSLLFILFSILYIMNNRKIIVIILLVLSISLIIHSLKKSNNEDSSIIIINGNISFKNMYKNHYSIKALYNEFKKNKILYIDNDLCGILNNNKLTLYHKNNIVNRPISIILNGKIFYNELYLIGKDKKWLEKKIGDKNRLEDILYSYYYDNVLYVIKK